ncbi:hypothetical protein EYC84_011679 [Monilinia fructicola]|uniref:Uncharacterized protein n=1 Tax=Monilinia fructicola TaxID=38448 RepID=A0A5M9J508_MONFR|nr:hypothetical protein EYC84_011679 [Monilinia fructicola]
MESDIRRDNRIQRQLLLENRIKQSQNFGDADVESLPEAHSAEMMGGSKNFQQSHGQPQYQPSNSRGVANGGSFPVFHPAQGMGAVSANIHHPKPRRMIPGDFHGTKIYTHMSLNSSAQSFMNGGLVGATNNLHSNPNNGGFPDIHDQPYQPWMVDSFNGSANTLSYQTFNSSGMEYDNGGYQQPMNNGPIGNTNGFLPYQSQPAPRGTSSGFGQKQPNGNCGGNFGGADMNRTMADLMGWMDKVSPEGEWSGMN